MSAWPRWLVSALLLGMLACTTDNDAVEDPEPRPAASVERQGPDVLVVTWDTVRADRVGRVVNGESTTPTWDRLAREGVVFDHARTVSPITLPAHASLMTGLYPPNHGARNNGFDTLSAEPPVLSEAFAAAGHATGAFVSGAVLEAHTGILRGFAHQDDDTQGSPQRPYRVGDRTADAALSWWSTLPPNQAAFTWVHLFDAHRPWVVTPDEWEKTDRDPYQAEIARVDRVTGRLLDALDAAGRLDHTIVIVTADHGEGLGEHGEMTHAWFAYDSTVRIPLVVWWGDQVASPGVRGRVVSDPVSLVDLAPTLRELSQLPVVPTDGVSLTGALKGGALEPRDLPIECVAPVDIMNAAPIFGTITRDRHSWFDVPLPEHHDLAADPGQSHNLYVDSAQPQLAQAISVMDRRWDPSARGSIDAEQRAQLEALGYLSADIETDQPQDPKEALAAFQLLVADETDRSPEEILVAIDAWTGVHGDQAVFAILKADTLGDLGRVDARLAVLEDAAARWPDNTEVQQAVRQFRKARADAEALLPAIERALQGPSPPPTAQADRGATLRALGRIEEAEQALREAVRAHPEDTEARRQLASLLAGQGQLEAAATVLQAVGARDPRLVCDLGRIQVAQNKDAGLAALEACWKAGGTLTPQELSRISNVQP